MLKNQCQLECKIEGKSFQFTCDPDSSTNFIKEALFKFINYIGQVEDAAQAKQCEKINATSEEKIDNDEESNE